MKTKRKKIPRLFVSATQDGIIGVQPTHPGSPSPGRPDGNHARARRWQTKAEKELSAYFSGRVRSLTTPCDLQGLTPFTHAVLRTAGRIPYGEVRSYRWIAQRIGRPKAIRAVGNALARNPVPIFIPCHRVVRSDGTLGGYALGLDLKQSLLDMEKNNAHRPKR